MRRKDFKAETAVLDELLAAAPVGHLGIVDGQGYPRVVPLNFVWHGGKIYFHGALDGEKFSYFSDGAQKAAFSVDTPYASIPSYWISEQYACPATIFFKAAHIKGTGRLVTDAAEKACALQTLMEKYQPEGGHAPITAGESLYRRALEEVAVFRIDPEHAAAKAKFAQNRTEDSRRDLIERLERRNGPLDRATADEIRKTLG